jgi:hypothetical protein
MEAHKLGLEEKVLLDETTFGFHVELQECPCFIQGVHLTKKHSSVTFMNMNIKMSLVE